MIATNQAQRQSTTENHDFHVVNIYVPEECYSFARSHLRELIRQVEGDFPSASVVVAAGDCVSVGSVGFDLPPVYSLVLHDFVRMRLREPRTLWERFKDWMLGS